MSDVIKELRYYVTLNGNAPAEDWLAELRDRKGARIIKVRLDRLSLGNPGDHRAVGLGVWELRIHFGPGYRVYYAEENGQLIILLCGGDKDSQERDIKRAHEYWLNYRRQII